VWPLDRLRQTRDVLRIGREAVERWSSTSEGQALVQRRPLQRAGEPEAPGLAEALAALVETQGGQALRSFDVVLESAWLPLMLVPTGQGLWSTSRLQALLRHRLGDLYGGKHDPVDGWELRLDHRVGESQAVGYGLAPSTRAAVMAACAAVNVRVGSVQPALAWGLRRLEPAVRRAPHAWWVWVEQDRAIVCRLERGRVTAMNAGAPVPRDAAHAQRLIAVEARRCGFEPPSRPAIVAGWSSSTRSGAGAPHAGAQPVEASA
jgi:hypothetical protein